jgi:hypothetical protein
MTSFTPETLRERPDPPRRRGRWLPLLIVAVGVLAVISVWLRPIRLIGWDTTRITAQLFYVSIAPPPLAPVSIGRSPISVVRVHYFIRNNGTSDYRFPSSAHLMQREGVALRAAPAGMTCELPPSVPAVQQREIVVNVPYPGESLDPAEWAKVYPEYVPAATDTTGRAPRVMLTVDDAKRVMEKRSLTSDALLRWFDVIGDGPARECTLLGRAVIRRKFPRLSGFAVVDETNRLRIELPLPR